VLLCDENKAKASVPVHNNRMSLQTSTFNKRGRGGEEGICHIDWQIRKIRNLFSKFLITHPGTEPRQVNNTVGDGTGIAGPVDEPIGSNGPLASVQLHYIGEVEHANSGTGARGLQKF
jgi:hypothetical protein